MDEMGMTEKEKVKKWYDGFVFGQVRDIYNPWSIINYLDTGKLSTYWANTSANSLVETLLREGNRQIKENFETLMQGWFKKGSAYYNDFIKALLLGNLDAMNEYMNRVTASVFSSFDTGKNPSHTEPERLHGVKATTSSFKEQNSCVCFYHGFVLGLMMELQDRYIITSNRESGFGRYDVMLEPKVKELDAIILEFKIFRKNTEETLSDTLNAALIQIEEKQYAQTLIDHGIAPERIRQYGFAFRGKEVLIG